MKVENILILIYVVQSLRTSRHRPAGRQECYNLVITTPFQECYICYHYLN